MQPARSASLTRSRLVGTDLGKPEENSGRDKINLVASSSTKSVFTRRSGGRAAAKYGLPAPSTRDESKADTHRSGRARKRPAASCEPATPISPSISALSRLANASRSVLTSVAFAPTAFKDREAPTLAWSAKPPQSHARSFPTRAGRRPNSA
jgi:hypothetical protein